MSFLSKGIIFFVLMLVSAFVPVLCDEAEGEEAPPVLPFSSTQKLSEIDGGNTLMQVSIDKDLAAADAIAIVDGADVSPLPGDVFMRYQEIKLAGDGCSSNYRFLIYANGGFYLQQNSGEDCAGRPAGTRFNKPFDSTPTKILDEVALGTIRKALARNHFSELPAVALPVGRIFDGAMKIMEVRSPTGIKRVISIKNASRLVESIIETIWEQIY